MFCLIVCMALTRLVSQEGLQREDVQFAATPAVVRVWLHESAHLPRSSSSRSKITIRSHVDIGMPLILAKAWTSFRSLGSSRKKIGDNAGTL
jgi:hypothetical protein